MGIARHSGRSEIGRTVTSGACHPGRSMTILAAHDEWLMNLS
jgi:hypothetical protein